MNAIGALIEAGARTLRAAGIEGARAEARLLLEAASGIERARQLARPESDVEAQAAERYRSFLSRREAREPIARILGRREFWSLPFAINRDTLDPRPDSETLVQLALDHVEDRSRALRVLDFGTGSGCLLLALLWELPHARGLGIDRSLGAVEMALANASALGLGERARFASGDWDEAVSGEWDIVIANPPYIASAEIDPLQPEVARFEPRLALDGGRDGLDAYRRLMPAARRLLAPGGFAAFEFGLGQEAALRALASNAGLAWTETAADLSQRARAALFRR